MNLPAVAGLGLDGKAMEIEPEKCQLLWTLTLHHIFSTTFKSKD